MMASVDPSVQIRIAIGLCALRFKPRDQSCGAYVLDLQDRFAGARTASQGGLGPEWRERALELEKQLKELKDVHESDKIELVALRARPASEHSSIDPITKKKGKNKQQAQARSTLPKQGRTELQGVLDGLDRSLSPALSTRSLLAIFQRLRWLEQGLTDFTADSANDPCQTISVILGSFHSGLETLSSLFGIILSTIDLRPQAQDPNQILNAVDAFLDHLVSTTFGLFAGLLKRFGKPRSKINKKLVAKLTVACDEIFGALGELIFIPLVRALFPLSQTYVSTTLGKGKEVVDIRMGLVGMLEGSMATVDKSTSELHGDAYPICGVECLRFRVALEGVRELMEMYSARPIDPGRLEQDRRTRRLARKDTVWLLCDVLRVVFSCVSADRTQRDRGSSESKLLSDEMLERMGELVKKMERGGEMEKSIVLGVVERGWMSGLGTWSG